MKKLKHVKPSGWISLAIATALSVLFVIFNGVTRKPFYEIIDTSMSYDFAEEMYGNNLYLLASILTVVVVWTVGVVYYLIIDKNSKPYKIGYWLLTVGAVLVFVPLIINPILISHFNNAGISAISDIVIFSAWNELLCAVLYIIVSFCIRPFSINGESTPF